MVIFHTFTKFKRSLFIQSKLIGANQNNNINCQGVCLRCRINLSSSGSNLKTKRKNICLGHSWSYRGWMLQYTALALTAPCESLSGLATLSSILPGAKDPGNFDTDGFFYKLWI
jgi:hypothetical protein